jgi:hypothetical protein
MFLLATCIGGSRNVLLRPFVQATPPWAHHVETHYSARRHAAGRAGCQRQRDAPAPQNIHSRVRTSEPGGGDYVDS